MSAEHESEFGRSYLSEDFTQNRDGRNLLLSRSFSTISPLSCSILALAESSKNILPFFSIFFPSRNFFLTKPCRDAAQSFKIVIHTAFVPLPILSFIKFSQREAKRTVEYAMIYVVCANVNAVVDATCERLDVSFSV